MTTKIICAYHTGSPEKFDPIMMKYPNVFVPVLCNACNYEPGTSLFFDKLQKDNDGENISEYNSNILEGTAYYWAYKNYDKIGNPDMIGMSHYRRIMDIDYYNLDYDTIYLRRDPVCEPCVMPGCALNYSYQPLVEFVMDEYFNIFPEYKDVYDIAKYDLKMFDKNIFIMNKYHFFDFCSYMTKCFRLVLITANRNMWKWWNEDNFARIGFSLFSRGDSYITEIMSALYFERMYMQKRKIQIVNSTKDSFCEY